MSRSGGRVLRGGCGRGVGAGERSADQREGLVVERALRVNLGPRGVVLPGGVVVRPVVGGEGDRVVVEGLLVDVPAGGDGVGGHDAPGDDVRGLTLDGRDEVFGAVVVARGVVEVELQGCAHVEGTAVAVDGERDGVSRVAGYERDQAAFSRRPLVGDDIPELWPGRPADPLSFRLARGAPCA